MKLKVCQDTTCAASETDRPKQPPLVLWRRVSMSQQASAQAPRARSLGLPFDARRSPPVGRAKGGLCFFIECVNLLVEPSVLRLRCIGAPQFFKRFLNREFEGETV